MTNPFRLVSTVCLVTAALVLASCAAGVPSTAPSLSVGSSPSSGPSSSAAPTASPSAATAPSPSPSAAPSAAAVWSAVAIPGAGTVFADIVALPTRLVIVGSGGDAGGTALAWSSADGTSWAAETPGGDGRIPGSAVAWGDRLLVAGGGGTGRCGHPVALDTWVRAADGTWSEAPWSDDFCVGGSGSAAVATDHALLAGIGSGDVPFVWRSTDGLRWTVTPVALADGAPQAAASIGGTDLVSGTGSTGAWVSRSTDGATWSARTPLGASQTLDVMAAVPLGARLAVIVRDRNHVVGTLLTDDGVTFDSVVASGLDGDTLARVVAVEGGLVALGGDAAGPRAWTSLDGATWTPVTLPSDAASGSTLTGAAIFGGRAWLTGQVTTGTSGVGRAWMGPASLFGR
jgi:hypothetical protein